MKKFRILFAACLLAMATAVNAQSDAWSGVRASYNSFTFDASGADYDAISGFDLGYVKSFAVSKNLPLFVEAGGKILYVTGDVADGSSAKMFSIAVPVNFGYKYVINDKISVFPYVGAYLRGNISGKMEMEYSVPEWDEDNWTFVETTHSEKLDMFDSDEGDGKRLQFGLKIGATVNINNYNVGVSYGFDLNEVMDETKTKKLALTVGYNF